ncbi:MAG: serine hydrolase [Pirellulales bacterium]|nr:serine hydrolase [Pirellulales bacterium]
MQKKNGLATFGVVLLFGIFQIASATDPPSSTAIPLDRYLQPLIDDHQGVVAIAVKHLETNETFAHQADRVMPTASMIKFPIMVEAYHQAAEGRLDLDAMIQLQETDKVPGSGLLTPHFSPGMQLSIRDAIRLMIAFSDNTATNLVIDRVGIRNICDRMKQLGLTETRLNSKTFRRDTSMDAKRSVLYGLGSTTPAETVRLFELLHTGKLGDEAATRAMIEHLKACQEDKKLTRFLPPGTQAAHKGGSVAAVRCEGGILYSPSGPIALCVMTAENQDQSWSAENAGDRFCADAGLAIYQYFNSKGTTAGESYEPFLARGAFGEAVATLQRTLNARLDPSPNLGVDGDFGPATEEAVIRFQKTNAMEPDGRVGPAMWKKLLPLVTRDPPVPDPEVINGRLLPAEPADALDGPPFVTCKAWAIGDGETGALLWGQNEEKPFDFASTTKIMPSYLVCRLAEEDPTVLDETVVFSQRADNTPGTTAGVRAGERLPVRELLYGMMLPSGNDASVALAEHFGERFDAESEHSSHAPGPSDPLDRFLAEMNRTAKMLGMSHTTFNNTHGLTEKGHVASCHDLLRLVHAAMQLECFRTIVRTREHGTRVIGPSGYQRDLYWKTTNRLLPIQGYDGVKTGTTDAAGACLVASGRRGDDHLLIVLLGASSSDGRYSDARNLFRWAWKQRDF